MSGGGSGFEVGYRDEGGAEQRIGLADAWWIRFESARPARVFPQYKGQQHFPGRWWSATMGGHVGYESWLERDHLMLLDFDPAVVAVASQPFWLFWTNERGKARSHAPDYFARLADGGALVLDCRPVERIKPRDAAAFAATADACAQVGWRYRVAGAADAIVERDDLRLTYLCRDLLHRNTCANRPGSSTQVIGTFSYDVHCKQKDPGRLARGRRHPGSTP
ncbi:TnsA-like heteromeric transposase endonuclease subunit [Rhizomonospora bruguierae]|uniref:TnsA-like heteromeric transposase endonuclease subunit n=1 Tax=Rhizomonospora bruguierae TaxID=1581705 RepID=UPI0020BE2A74|nr:TnsA-like heteromeric transposase endonuclease subunit [Micromonospora sp. NBRC 107566]